MVPQPVRLGNAQFNGAFGERAQTDRLCCSVAGGLQTTNNGCAEFSQINPVLHEHMRGNAVAFLQQAEQKVFGPNMPTAQSNGFAMREVQYSARP